MCGIAGYIRRASAGSGIEEMLGRLSHRGPDASGTVVRHVDEWTVTLGHRRLSIVDLANGAQPMSNEDQRVWVTFNGEIYNHQSLRDKLIPKGHRFVTHCDTEAILHHYEETGRGGLAGLDGMFAFALWDEREQTLLLARDRAGIKPLYYAPLHDGGIAFASELHALLALSELGRSIDPQSLATFFFMDYVLPPASLIDGVYRLPPGHFLTWKGGQITQVAPFWTLRDVVDHSADEVELADRLWDAMKRSVKSQLMSDVPLGVFLSGGIDSSTVALLARESSPTRVHTFSIAFDEPDFDESAFARLVADHLGTNHTVHTVLEKDMLTHLDSVLDCMDEPIGDSSIVPTYFLSQLTARSVKVALGGDGGDELFGGYPTYLAHRQAMRYAYVPPFVRRTLVEPVVRSLPVSDRYQSFEWKARRFALRWDDDPSLRHLRWMSNTDLPELPSILSKYPAGQDSWSRLTDTSCEDPVRNAMNLDFRTYLPNAVLTKVDRASMAHSLEVRPALLSNELVNFAFALPTHLRHDGKVAKRLMKRAAAGKLPAAIVNRKKKGFGIPLSRWLKGQLHSRLRSICDDSPLWHTGLLNQQTFRRWASDHSNQRADHSRSLWGLIVLDHWSRRIGITQT